MPLNLEPPEHEYALRGADGALARVNDRILEASFIIAPDRLVDDWPVRAAHALRPDDLAPLLALDPELVILGTGPAQVFPPAEAMAACMGRGVGLEAMRNDAAARTFNVLAGEGRRVVAGFILPG